MQLRGLRVEIGLGHADRQRGVDARGGGGACGGFGGYAPEGGCSEEIVGTDEVVGKPLGPDDCASAGGESVLGEECKRSTMSSGSSGKSVMVPEPSRSIFCLISRMIETVQRLSKELKRKDWRRLAGDGLVMKGFREEKDRSVVET